MSELFDRLKTALADRYAIERELGRGGMATVYLAEDLKYQRKVAIKVLHPELAATLGPERFLREIKIAAQLSHPHILPLLDSGEAGGFLYYVMPALAGLSLRERLGRETQLPIDEAIEITRATASALDYAHRHDVIHRDIKPENILLHDGQPVVADFGIALAVSAAGGSRLTETGLSIGTPEYMSPEQAMGDRTIDGRSDIYSLGCVLFEMLTGEPPHTGPTAQAIVGKILTQNISRVTLRRPSVPGHVERALQKALAPLAADRFGHAAQFAAALLPSSTTEQGRKSPSTVPRVSDLLRAARKYWVPGGLAAATMILAAFLVLGRTPRDSLPISYAVTMPPGVEIAVQIEGSAPLAISPDGRTLAFVGFDGHASRIYLRRAEQLEPIMVPGTEGGSGPFFSSDGKWLGFFSGTGVSTKVYKVSMNGGTPVPIVEYRGLNPRGASWDANGAIVLASRNNRGLDRLSVESGRIDPRTIPDTSRGEVSHRYPFVLPGNKGVLFTAISPASGSDRTSIVSIGPSGGRTQVLVADGTTPQFADPGFLVYARFDGSLLAAPLDPDRRNLRGSPIPVLTDVSMSRGSGYASYALSNNGTLAYVRGTGQRRLVIADAAGVTTQPPIEPAPFGVVTIAPDGRRVAAIVAKPMYDDIWVYDLTTSTSIRLTSQFGASRATWSPDGKRLVYSHYRVLADKVENDLYLTAADGTGRPTLLVRDVVANTPGWSADGREVFFEQPDSTGHLDIWAIDTRGSRSPRPVLQAAFDQRQPAASPDGRWLAYTSNESGIDEVYVRGTGGGPRYPVSRGGGIEPRWSATGRLFYRAENAVMVATLGRQSDWTAATRVSFYEGNFRRYEPFPNGDRVLLNIPADSSPQVVVIVNWIAEVARKLAAEQ